MVCCYNGQGGKDFGASAGRAGHRPRLLAKELIEGLKKLVSLGGEGHFIRKYAYTHTARSSLRG